MADRHARFRKEIVASDKRISQYLNRLDQLFRAWILPLLEEVNLSNEAESFAILADIRSGRFTPELRDHTQNVLSLYVAELENLKGRFRISQDDIRETEALAQMEADNLRAELITSATVIASTAGFSIAAGEAIRPTRLVTEFTEGRFNRLETGLVTNSAGYRSSFEIRKASEVEKTPRFAYVGPLDDKNRPFCRFVLTKKSEYTLAEIKQLDKHPDAQLLPTFVYGGGYNCRHRWIFIKRA